MNELIHIIPFNHDILKLMCQIKPFKSQWSLAFLNKTANLIASLRKFKSNIDVIQYDLKLDPLKSLSPYNHMDTLIEIFKDNQYTDYKQIINSYLSENQSSILFEIVNDNLIQSTDDFNYLVGHLPFYRELINALSIVMEKKISSNSPVMKMLYSNTFIPPIITQWIVSNCNRLTSINFHIIEINATVNLKILHTHHKSDQDICKIVQSVASNLAAIFHIHKINSPQLLNLYYIMTPFTKKLKNFKINHKINNKLISKLKNIPDLRYNYCYFSNPISNLSVNSGVTSRDKFSREDNFITIWREEEFSKVFIHELIHYYDLEKGNEFEILYYLNVSNNYPHYSKEMFTELQTWFLYTIINLSKIDYEFNLSDIRFILNYERFYSLVNVYRIFSHYSFNNAADLFTTNKNTIINANASILYYYILKSIALLNITGTTEKILIPTIKFIECRPFITKSINKQIIHTLHSDEFYFYIDALIKIKPKLIDSLNMMGITYKI